MANYSTRNDGFFTTVTVAQDAEVLGDLTVAGNIVLGMPGSSHLCFGNWIFRRGAYSGWNSTSTE